MIQKYFLVVILIIIVIVLFLKSLNIEYFDNKWQSWTTKEIETCVTNYNSSKLPKNKNYCCSAPMETIVNSWDRTSAPMRDIHIVNPRDPCCIKSCINDFTNVDCKKHSGDIETGTICHKQEDDGEGIEGELRPEFKKKNIDYFLTSGCYSCVNNFKGAVDLLANPNVDPTCKKTK